MIEGFLYWLPLFAIIFMMLVPILIITFFLFRLLGLTSSKNDIKNVSLDKKGIVAERTKVNVIDKKFFLIFYGIWIIGLFSVVFSSTVGTPNIPSAEKTVGWIELLFSGFIVVLIDIVQKMFDTSRFGNRVQNELTYILAIISGIWLIIFVRTFDIFINHEGNIIPLCIAVLPIFFVYFLKKKKT